MAELEQGQIEVEVGFPASTSTGISQSTDGSNSWLHDTKDEPGMQADIEDDFAKGDFDTTTSSRSSSGTSRRTMGKRLIMLAVCVVVIAGIAIGIVFAVGGKDDSPTPAPTQVYAGEVQLAIEEAANGVGLSTDFSDPNAYQTKALDWVLTKEIPAPGISLSRDEQAIQLYALACIIYNTDSVRSDWTDFHFGEGAEIPGWYTKRGWLGEPSEVCTNWHGLTCDDDGRVTKIELDSNGLTGYFPPETSLLKDSLTYLDLFSNLVNNRGDAGNSWLGQMTNMEYLFYGSTSFEYDGVPTEIGKLTKLKEYDFSYTLYFGELKGETWAGLTDLNYLVMDGNAYNSSLPTELTQLPNLQYLYSGFAFLEGNLDFVPTMPAIFELWVDDNPGLAGTIPKNLPDAETLVSFSVTNCDLIGTLPTEIGTMQEMIQMWFYDNKLTGTVPTEYGDLVKMKILNIQKNDIVGDMPGQLCTRRVPLGRLEELEADCDGDIVCPGTCCTCCGETCIAN